MHFASAADHTTLFLHSYPIKQIKLWDSGNHLINFYRVWWQGKVEHGVRIMLLVRQNGLDRDKISSIALNSLGPTRQGQKNVFAKGENVITNSCNTACVFVWFCVHVRSSPWAQKKQNKKQWNKAKILRETFYSPTSQFICTSSLSCCLCQLSSTCPLLQFSVYWEVCEHLRTTNKRSSRAQNIRSVGPWPQASLLDSIQNRTAKNQENLLG